MLPLLGPWCDTELFTDVHLLVGLAETSRDTAVGVLTNRNLTGPDFTKVVDLANLTAANVDTAGGAALMANRDPDDQFVLLLAAQRRSEAAASRLMPHLSPPALLRAHEFASTRRMKGSREFLRGLAFVAGGREWLRHFDTPAFTEVSDRVRESDPARTLAFRALSSMGDRSRLIDLTADLAATEAFPPDQTVHEDLNSLLLATAGHPDVVAHWTVHGGAWGRRVAAADHRHGDTLLPALGGDPDLFALLVANPAIPADTRARMLGENLTAQCLVGWQAMAQLHQIDAFAKQFARSARWTGPDVANPAHVHVDAITSNTNAGNVGSLPQTRLLAYDILTQRNDVPSRTVGQLAQLLLRSPDDLLLPDAVVDTLSRVHTAHAARMDRLVAGQLAKVLGLPEGRPSKRADPTMMQAFALNESPVLDPSTGILRSTIAGLTTTKLSSVDEYVELYRLQSANIGDRVGDLVEAAALKKKRARPQPSAYHDVLGDALGPL